jgi:hypothetical protein
MLTDKGMTLFKSLPAACPPFVWRVFVAGRIPVHTNISVPQTTKQTAKINIKTAKMN